MLENKIPVLLDNFELSEEEITTKLKQLPKVISSRAKLLKELQNKVKEANKAADEASRKAEEMGGYKEKSFLGIKFRTGNTKDIVNNNLDVTKENSRALKLNADASALTNQFQQELTKACEFLFYLGCYNIAANESMITSLNKQLKGNVDGVVLSDEVKEQFRNVVKRLKSQQNVLYRQQKLEKNVKKTQEKIKENYNLQLKLKKELEKKELSYNKLDIQISDIKKAQESKDLLDEEQSGLIKSLQDQLKLTSDIFANHTSEIEELKEQNIKQNASCRKNDIILYILLIVSLCIGILNFLI